MLLELDIGCGAGNLTSDEGPSSSRTFVVEQNTVASVHSVRLAIVHGNPVGVKFGDTIRRSRIEGGGFRLGSLDDLSIEFRG